MNQENTPREITVSVRLDAGTFRRFCRFDMFRLHGKWKRPVIFALIMTSFAAAALLSGKDQSLLIAAVLLAAGLGMPLVYFGTFLAQVNRQAARYNLASPRPVYTVRLGQKGIHVTNDQKEEMPLDMAWENCKAAYRVRRCIYLYVNDVRAFLLPDGQADAETAQLWNFIERHMGDRAHGRYTAI